MEEKDKLKDFINQNRNDFDFHEPPNLNFGKLIKNEESKIKTKEIKQVPLRKVLQIAAVITVIACIGGALYLNSITTVSSNNNLVVNEPLQNFQLSSVSEEMAETENYYVKQVNIKQKEIEELGFSEDIEEELNLLDEEFRSLKDELGEDIDNDIIIEKMILNYQLKLDLLDQILNSINKVKNKPSKKEKDESNYTIYY